MTGIWGTSTQLCTMGNCVGVQALPCTIGSSDSAEQCRGHTVATTTSSDCCTIALIDTKITGAYLLLPARDYVAWLHHIKQTGDVCGTFGSIEVVRIGDCILVINDKMPTGQTTLSYYQAEVDCFVSQARIDVFDPNALPARNHQLVASANGPISKWAGESGYQ